MIREKEGTRTSWNVVGHNTPKFTVDKLVVVTDDTRCMG